MLSGISVRRVPRLHTIEREQLIALTEVVARRCSMPVSIRQLVRLLDDDGQFRHAEKPGTVTVAGKPSADVPIGTLNSVLKQAGLNPSRQPGAEEEKQ